METIYDMTTILAKYTTVLAQARMGNTYYLPAIGYMSDGTAEIIYDKLGYDSLGRDVGGYNAAGYNLDGFKKDGYSDAGYDKYDYDRDGYDRAGYDKNGYDRYGYDRAGYDKSGYGRNGYDQNGYDQNGYNANGYDRNGYDKSGYDKNGYDRNGNKKNIIASYSAIEEKTEEALVEINKTNFPGLYQILKERGYDDNQDGYLSESECNSVTYFGTGKKVSSLEGIRYFPNLNQLSLPKYTGTKITITKKNIKLMVLKVSSQKTKLKIDAPYIKYLDLSTDDEVEDVKVNSKLKTLDISNCKKLKYLYVVQNLSTLKLPGKGNDLRFIECQNLKVKSLDLKNCVKLGYLCITDTSNLKSLKLSNNTNLRGIVVIRNKKLKSIDASKSKKLSAVYVYGNQNDATLKKNIKLPKGKNVKFPKNLIPLFKIEKVYSKWQD